MSNNQGHNRDLDQGRPTRFIPAPAELNFVEMTEEDLIEHTLFDIGQMLYSMDRRMGAAMGVGGLPDTTEVDGVDACRGRHVWVPLWRAALLAGGLDNPDAPEFQPPLAGEAMPHEYSTPERRVAHLVSRNVWIPVLRNGVARKMRPDTFDSKPVDEVVQDGLNYLRSVRPIAEAGGLIYMIQAYNAGVPVEDIIAGIIGKIGV